MTNFPLLTQLPGASRLILGCMGLGGGWNQEPVGEAELRKAREAVEAALSVGITLFDHADIYTHGKAEQVFGTLLSESPSLRDRLLLQSKCGIRFADEAGPGRYDLSAWYIERSVEASLQRLRTDRLDLLLLHRPDPLVDVHELAESLSRLHRSGKVRCFGVSNMHAAQLAWLQSACSLPLAVNQLEMSLLRLDWLEAGTTFNDGAQGRVDAWAGTLEHCQRQGVQLQAWGALAQGRWREHAVAGTLQTMAARLELVPETLLVAWLLRHPSCIQPVIGSTDPARIRACAAALDVQLSREDWYALYVAARGRPLP
ncbi:aldo/keto reductase family oxidoreductase [Inhella sp.]|uniref:aldo/keto reductase n=1 Tax=Inhella sp. TaxID=1921806 RepID=UPI0035AF5D68